jgi:hypothetical protein
MKRIIGLLMIIVVLASCESKSGGRYREMNALYEKVAQGKVIIFLEKDIAGIGEDNVAFTVVSKSDGTTIQYEAPRAKCWKVQTWYCVSPGDLINSTVVGDIFSDYLKK